MKTLVYIQKTLILLYFSMPLFATNPTYNVMTEEFNPFGFYQDNGQLTGVAVEITRLLLNDLNHPNTINVLPWARAIRDAETLPDQVLFAVARTPEREDKFQWVGPILSDNIYFFKRSNNTDSYKQLKDARKVGHIAVSRGFPEQDFLAKRNFKNIVLTHNPESSVKLLLSDRVDLIVAGATVIDDMVKQAGFSITEVKQTGIKLFGTDLYIALSKNIPLAQVNRWQNALDEIKKNEQYAEIIKRYHFN